MGEANTQRTVGQGQTEGQRREKHLSTTPPPPKAQEKGAESEQLLPDSLAPDLATEFSGPLTDQAGPSVPQGRCW